MRSRIVLLAARGLSNSEIASELKFHRNVAGKWRSRFLEHRLDGLLDDEPRPFVWTKTADEILDSIARYCTRINESRH